MVVEAATHHTPSIAYRSAGGVADSIQEGRTGLLVDDGQEPFTGALEALLADEKLRHTLGDEAARFAAQFTWPQAVQKWEHLLQEVIDRYHS